MRYIYFFISFFFLTPWANQALAQKDVRSVVSLNAGWHTIAHNENKNAYNGFEAASYDVSGWKPVNVPHNWDKYEGYRRMLHGNRHGYAWYRKSFQPKDIKKGKRYFLWFEGVSSYATVWLNGKQVGYHAGGRTSFTIDVTHAIDLKKTNVLSVRADHPAEIRDLPWVCGGCSEERGFSEGSQPMGIFRPVHLITTDDVRIEPFGVHIWNDTTVSEKSAKLHLNTEVKNYGSAVRSVSIVNRLLNSEGREIVRTTSSREIAPGETAVINQQTPEINSPRLWSVEDPYLYTMVSEIVEGNKVVDRTTTRYGIRWISWPVGREGDDNRFFLNGKPVFINGVGEYEHLLGEGHAFSDEQIRSRAMQIKAAGFNSFRDAHQPHNLRYQEHWDKLGILSWTQMSAHIWFDNPAFRENFKRLLTEWVKERRNDPSVVLWGLQNESTMPEDFSRECTELIRQLDPTASAQRKVTTCNGGRGTDWDVPQNWTGTYGGNPALYAEDVQRQVLIGEYGAWRTLDLHTEGEFDQNGVFSEDRMTQLMEMKVRLADSVKDKTSGHYFWIFTSHDNPGRVQGGEGLRELDRVGPVNYKGLLTPWEEPLDVYYMFRSNYAPKETEPMVYIVSHTWPDRWTAPGKKDGITVYSNCDEVELFNDVEKISLGKRKKNGVGTHFRWDDVNINYNVLYAVGYVDGKPVAKDYIVLRYLPESPNFKEFLAGARAVTAPKKNLNYLYRVNCGGPDYVDSQGNKWLADRRKADDKSWGSLSWTEEFPGMPAFFASQRRSHDPIKGTADWALFQTFRYGRDKLSYEFPAEDGEYTIELYFNEPWLGTGGGMDCTGWRLFDVAVNGQTLIEDLDIWKEAGHDGALKKTLKARARDGKLVISFPTVKSGQAIISAIAIASSDKKMVPATGAAALIQKFTHTGASDSWQPATWLDAGDRQYTDEEVFFTELPSNLYGAEWIRTSRNESAGTARFVVNTEADVFIGLDSAVAVKPQWLTDYEDTKTYILNSKGMKFQVFRKRFEKGAEVTLGDKGTVSGGQASMYTVAALPASTLQPAYDLKPTVTYRAEDATISEGVKRTTVNDKEVATLTQGSGAKVEFTISPGVADVYSLTIRYANLLEKTHRMKMELLAADGTLMKEEIVEFSTSRPGKWNYFTTNTGSMINAGHYIVRFTAIDAEGLSLYCIDMQ